MKLIFLDTETTGDSTQKGDRLIQLAYRTTEGVDVNELFNPGIPISYRAMAVHHITEEMVQNKPVFETSPHKQKLQGLLTDHILVAHNAPFDYDFLQAEGIEARWIIDTFKVAYAVIQHDQDGEELPSHSLQFLRYALGINVEGANAHDAFGDILVLEKLFYYLLDKMRTQSAGDETSEVKSDKQLLSDMINISNRPLLLRKFKFGKHRGRTFAEVFAEAPDYFEWMIKQPDLDENLEYTLRHYLR